jgi:hypothetical protein
MEALKGSRSISLLFLELRRQMGLVVNATARPLCPRGKDAVHVTQEVGRAPGTVWTAAENLALTGIRSSDRPNPQQLSIPTEVSKIVCRIT